MSSVELHTYDHKNPKVGVWYRPVPHSSGWPTVPEIQSGFSLIVIKDNHLGLVCRFKLEQDNV